MDAIKLLTADHDKVKKLLTELTATTSRASKKRTELIEQIKQELETHTIIEEEIFYPAYRSAGGKSEDELKYFEALEEHRAVGDLLIPDLMATPVESEKFSGRAKVLSDLVRSHIHEEESEMFKRTRKLMDKRTLESLGQQLEERKDELMHAAA